MTGPKYKANINTRAFCNMLRLLHEGDVTKTQIRDQIGIESATCVRWMSLLGSDQPLMKGRLVYISGWQRAPRGNPSAMWSYGFEMPDVPKPHPMTATEYARRWRLKKRITPYLVRRSKSNAK